MGFEQRGLAARDSTRLPTSDIDLGRPALWRCPSEVRIRSAMCNRSMAVAHPHRTQTWRDLRVAGLIVAFWLSAWALLIVSTWFAGGNPSASPLGFIDPTRLGRRLGSTGVAFRWWVLVDPATSVSAWRFWATLGLMSSAGCGCCTGIWRLLIRRRDGRPSGRRVRARRTLGASRRAARPTPAQGSKRGLPGRHTRTNDAHNTTRDECARYWPDAIGQDIGVGDPQPAQLGGPRHRDQHQERVGRAHRRLSPIDRSSPCVRSHWRDRRSLSHRDVVTHHRVRGSRSRVDRRVVAVRCAPAGWRSRRQ